MLASMSASDDLYRGWEYGEGGRELEKEAEEMEEEEKEEQEEQEEEREEEENE